MRVWITGLSGFLASHVAEALIAEGHEITGNDNYLCGSEDNIPKDVKCWRLDCCNYNFLAPLMAEFKPDVVIHAAATAAEGFSVFSPHFITRNIYEASVSTFSAAIAAGAKRVVTMSSMARYGHGKPPFVEDDIANPIDPYGIAKVAAEQTLKVLCETHDVKYSILVPHNIIGVRQEITPYRNVASIFLNRLKLGLSIYIYGDGEQKRCFSPVKDCIPSILHAVHGDGDGEIINIGPDNGEISINYLLDLCEEVTGIKGERIHLPPRPVTDSVKEAYCSSDKARKLLGYKEQQSLLECLQEMSDSMAPKPFDYSFPIEIESDKMPRTWKEKL